MARTPSVQVIEQLLRQGWTYDMIGRHYGVQAMTIWRKLQRAGKVGGRPNYRDFLPWKVAPEHRDLAVFEKLKDLYQMENGIELSGPQAERRRRRALSLKAQLEKTGAVVGYHPKFPPNDASETRGGFFYARRRDTDGKYHRS